MKKLLLISLLICGCSAGENQPKYQCNSCHDTGLFSTTAMGFDIIKGSYTPCLITVNCPCKEILEKLKSEVTSETLVGRMETK